MTTIVQGSPTDTGTGFFMGIVLLILAAALFFVFGLPLINSPSNEVTPTTINRSTTINMPLPAEPTAPARTEPATPAK